MMSRIARFSRGKYLCSGSATSHGMSIIRHTTKSLFVSSNRNNHIYAYLCKKGLHLIEGEVKTVI